MSVSWGAQTSPTDVTSKTEMVPQSRKVKEPAGKVKPRYPNSILEKGSVL